MVRQEAVNFPTAGSIPARSAKVNMTRVKNVDTTAETPLPELQRALDALKPGQKIQCQNTKTEILKTQENLIRRRHEITGADSHLAYIEAMIIAEANGNLEFKK